MRIESEYSIIFVRLISLLYLKLTFYCIQLVPTFICINIDQIKIDSAAKKIAIDFYVLSLCVCARERALLFSFFSFTFSVVCISLIGGGSKMYYKPSIPRPGTHRHTPTRTHARTHAQSRREGPLLQLIRLFIEK